MCLPFVIEPHVSSLCDTFDSFRLYDDHVLVVSLQTLVDHIDNKTDSCIKINLCPSNVEL